MEDNLYPKINELLNSSEVTNLEFKIEDANGIYIFFYWRKSKYKY